MEGESTPIDLLAAAIDESSIDEPHKCTLCACKLKSVSQENKQARVSHVIDPEELCDGCKRCSSKFLRDPKLRPEEAKKLRGITTKKLLEQRKLHLILDIDHTLLESIYCEPLKPRQGEYTKAIRDDLWILNYDNYRMCIKLRPFVRTFLKEASRFFEISLYTKATRLYAMRVARILDPEGCYFERRIISTPHDTPDIKYKTLNRVIAQKRAVAIVDDYKDIWPNDQKNLYVIERYRYFDDDDDEDDEDDDDDESEVDGALVRALKVLLEFHRKFFEVEDGKM